MNIQFFIQNPYRLLTRCKFLSLMFISLIALCSAHTVWANTYTVQTTGDSDLTCSVTSGSNFNCQTLRGAITAVNASTICNASNPDQINFAISSPASNTTDAQGNVYYYYTISPTNFLPDIYCPVVINGFSQNSFDGLARTPGTHSKLII